ncbi:GFA family protein [uncultured Thalassospira sp.]|uniref:GFA family protein n=1 Tax=uncultured Thalassospira sp. TaxID=404382 RepID=UPI0030D79FE2|tara:strand:- start:5855 stop:6307 length:453 start_codon:yes stop_codon:yes gene_type:complete
MLDHDQNDPHGHVQDHSGPARHHGGCHCGAVRYQVHGEIEDAVLCHCHLCAGLHGHVSAYASVNKDELHLIADDGLRWYRLSEKTDRGFCKECGSGLFWRVVRSKNIALTPGTLDGPSGIKTKSQIFCAFKGDYYPLDPSIPVFDHDDHS